MTWVNKKKLIKRGEIYTVKGITAKVLGIRRTRNGRSAVLAYYGSDIHALNPSDFGTRTKVMKQTELEELQQKFTVYLGTDPKKSISNSKIEEEQTSDDSGTDTVIFSPPVANKSTVLSSPKVQVKDNRQSPSTPPASIQDLEVRVAELVASSLKKHLETQRDEIKQTIKEIISVAPPQTPSIWPQVNSTGVLPPFGFYPSPLQFMQTPYHSPYKPHVDHDYMTHRESPPRRKNRTSHSFRNDHYNRRGRQRSRSPSPIQTRYYRQHSPSPPAYYRGRQRSRSPSPAPNYYRRHDSRSPPHRAYNYSHRHNSRSPSRSQSPPYKRHRRY